MANPAAGKRISEGSSHCGLLKVGEASQRTCNPSRPSWRKKSWTVNSPSFRAPTGLWPDAREKVVNTANVTLHWLWTWWCKTPHWGFHTHASWELHDKPGRWPHTTTSTISQMSRKRHREVNNLPTVTQSATGIAGIQPWSFTQKSMLVNIPPCCRTNEPAEGTRRGFLDDDCWFKGKGKKKH